MVGRRCSSEGTQAIVGAVVANRACAGDGVADCGASGSAFSLAVGRSRYFPRMIGLKPPLVPCGV
jgi:hypothetical protein